ncbi:FMN-binding protein [Acidobacteria bacterium ACD]|nr:MAG: FMN-binding protein [Acidobacteriota bacterium]MCE7958354.1 FMN-binding protein [Acidobacteria bacterium ACB2]MDL1950539.1 FMN-binding protein [Acidobacteria bacterium ACD]
MERGAGVPVLRTALLLAALPALLGLAGEGRAAVYETREKALARAFPPPARVERTTSYLTPEQKAAAEKAAEAPVESAVVTRYPALAPAGSHLGTAYFDQHVVRTQPEVLMVVVAPDRTLRSVDVLAFAEPEDYLPREGWLRRIPGKRAEDGLFVGRALSHVTGATLTTRAIAAAVRRVLALDALLPLPVPAAAPTETKR